MIDLSSAHTMVELAKRTVSEKVQTLARVLEIKIPIIRDAVWKPANKLDHHVFSKWVKLPVASLRGVNYGVKPTVLTTKQTTEPMCLVEDHSLIDEYLIKLAKDQKKYIFEEDLGHLEGVRQKFGTDFLYQSHADDIKGIDGLSVRYDTPASQDNVHDCGGDGSNVTSMWLIKWGGDSVFLIYPEASATPEPKMIDKAYDRVPDGEDPPGYFYAHITQFLFNFGVVVINDKYVQRIGSIEVSGAENTLDEDLIIKARNNVGDDLTGCVWYCNSTIKTQLDIIAKDKPNIVYTKNDPAGNPVTYAGGIPVRQWDSIVNTEDAI